MPKAKKEPAEPDVVLLMEFISGIRRGKKMDREALLARCPKERREELELAMEGAAALESVAREVRPFLTPAAQERSLKQLRRRLAKSATG